MSAYATINEAYGKDFKKKKEKKDKKKKKQSACHYYAQRYAKSQKGAEALDIGGLDNTDIYSKYDKNAPNKAYDLYANRQDFIKANKDSLEDCNIKEEQDYFDKLYAEHDFRPMMSNDGNNLMNVEPTQYDEIKYDNSIQRGIESNMNDDLNYETDDESIATSLEAKAGTVADNVPDNEKNVAKEPVGTSVTPKYESDKNYMDLGLYLISGILLIFILEQFVQIGIMMKDSRGGIREGGGIKYMNEPANYMYYAPPPQMNPQVYNSQMYYPQMYNPNMFKPE